MNFGFLKINGRQAGVWTAFLLVPIILVPLIVGSMAMGEQLYKSANVYFYGEEVYAARQADLNARKALEAKEAKSECEQLSLLAAVEAQNKPGASWKDGESAHDAVWQSPECIAFN